MRSQPAVALCPNGIVTHPAEHPALTKSQFRLSGFERLTDQHVQADEWLVFDAAA
jgi:hypothetical protein